MKIQMKLEERQLFTITIWRKIKWSMLNTKKSLLLNPNSNPKAPFVIY